VYCVTDCAGHLVCIVLLGTGRGAVQQRPNCRTIIDGSKGDLFPRIIIDIRTLTLLHASFSY
jgi:hypothetical protein